MSEKDIPLTEDVRFLLGEISSVVKTLPARMDRFEAQVQADFQGLHMRLLALEQANAKRSGAFSAAFYAVAVVSGFVGSLLSGLWTSFLKH